MHAPILPSRDPPSSPSPRDSPSVANKKWSLLHPPLLLLLVLFPRRQAVSFLGKSVPADNDVGAAALLWPRWLLTWRASLTFYSDAERQLLPQKPFSNKTIIRELYKYGNNDEAIFFPLSL